MSKDSSAKDCQNNKERFYEDSMIFGSDTKTIFASVVTILMSHFPWFFQKLHYSST